MPQRRYTLSASAAVEIAQLNLSRRSLFIQNIGASNNVYFSFTASSSVGNAFVLKPEIGYDPRVAPRAPIYARCNSASGTAVVIVFEE